MARKPEKRPIKLLFVVSDLHCGDTAALAPPGFLWGDDRNPLQLNPLQEWLWGRWVEFCGWAREYAGDDPYAVLVNGDCTEGIHHGSKGVWSTYHTDHIGASVECLRMLCDDAEKVFVVDGTECHTRQAEAAVGFALDAEVDPFAKGKFSARKWVFKINGIKYHATHHTSTSARKYLSASKLSIHLGDEIMRHRKDPPDVIIRAHCHTMGEYRESDAISITTPPWKGIDRHTIKVVPGLSRDTVEVGGVAFDSRGLEYGQIPRTVWQCYNTPRTKAVEL